MTVPTSPASMSASMDWKPVTSKPVYGYLMDEDENFIIDEEAAPVVKQIYSLSLSTPSLIAMKRTFFCGKIISVYIPTCR